jgi:hypothetical protein
MECCIKNEVFFFCYCVLLGGKGKREVEQDIWLANACTITACFPDKHLFDVAEVEFSNPGKCLNSRCIKAILYPIKGLKGSHFQLLPSLQNRIFPFSFTHTGL